MFSDVNSHDNLPPKLTLEVEPGGDSLKHLSNARKKSYENQLKKCLSCMSMLGMNNDERFVKINQIMTVFNGVQAPEHTRRCEKKEKEEECPELPEEMKKQLDAQIEAYTHIRKRIPVPQNLLKVAVVKKKLENVSRETFLKYFKKFDEECSVSIRSKLDFSKLPITPYDVKIEHESMIRQQMIERAEHLQRSIHDIAPHQQIPALIEMKALRLNDLQEMIRRQTLSTIERIVPNEFLLNPYSIRRTKEQYQRECRENPLKMSMERTRKAKNNEFLHCFLKNYREFREFHKSNNNRFSRVRKQMTLYHQSIAREKKRDELKNEKLRIQKLMQEDEEGYRAMLDEKKDQRLMHLLQQTDVYIDSLCNLVKQHQNSDGSNPSTSDISTKSMTDEYAGMDEETKAKLILEKARQDEDEYDNKTKSQMANYYATAHRIKEKITEQHQMMGGGDPNLKLKPYQIKGLEWMVSLYNNNLNGILADEMGLGKTIQTISFITYLMEKKRLNGPFLVIVPLSTLPNWAHEFAKWAPNVEMIPYKGTKDIRKNYEPIIKKGNFHVLLTTFEYVIKEKGLLGKLRWKYMIIDEGHRLKNNNCKLTLMLNTYFQAQNRLLITGTPLQNKLPELWALLNFLLPTIFSSCNSFEQWFNAPFATTGEKVELTEEETMLIIRRLHKVLRPFLLRRLKKEVESQLPDKMEFVVKCDMSALQRMLYRHMQKGLLLDGKHQSGGKTLMNTMMHLRKLCNHPFLFQHLEESCRLFWNVPEVTGEDLMRVSGKFELLDRIMPKLKATGHRILMFFQMTSMMTIVEDFLNYKQYKYLRLDGNTKSEERGQLLELFNAPDSEYFLFLLSTRAGGLGLNLQTADTVVIFDSDWNPHQDMQAQDRAHRIGQKQEVRVLRLITVNSVEEKILAAAKFKLNVDEKVIQAGKFDNRSTGAERKEILEQIIRAESEECEEDELPDDDAINEMISRNDKELEIFQAMDKARKLNEKNERPRLLTQEEIPSDILRAADEMEYQEKAKEEGREPYYEVMPGSRRKRKEVDYSVDSMTEEQFLQKIDQAEDDGTDSEANQNAFVMPQIIEKKVIEVKNVVDDEKRLHEHKKKEKKKHRDSDSDHEKEKKKKKKRKHGDDEDNERKLAKKLKREKERRDREKLAFDL